MRNTKDPKMPDDRDELIQRFNSWKCRVRNNLTMDKDVLAMFEIWKRTEVEKRREIINVETCPQTEEKFRNFGVF